MQITRALILHNCINVLDIWFILTRVNNAMHCSTCLHKLSTSLIYIHESWQKAMLCIRVVVIQHNYINLTSNKSYYLCSSKHCNSPVGPSLHECSQWPSESPLPQHLVQDLHHEILEFFQTSPLHSVSITNPFYKA